MRRPLELALGPVLLALVAAGLGSLALFAIAVGLALVYVGAHLAVTKAQERLVVHRSVDRQEIVEGTPLTLRFELGGLSRLPAGVEIFCRCGDWHALAMGENTVTWTIDHPGLHRIDPSPLRIRDDLGLFTRVLTVGEPTEILVLPVPAAVPRPVRKSATGASQDPEPDGLREYVRGTPINRIHWKSAARGGPLQERTFVPARDELPLVIVDTTGATGVEQVDWAARAAAGHVLALARRGGCRVLLPGDRTPTTLMDPVSQWPAVHRRLAALERGGPAAVNDAETRGAVQVRARTAPDHEVVPRGPLPPGVVPTADWAPA